VRPEVFGADGVVRVAVEQEVLEEAHVLEAEEGHLVLGLDFVRGLLAALLGYRGV
jgi:hypothetical protein